MCYLWNTFGKIVQCYEDSTALQRLGEPCVLSETSSREAGSGKETAKGEKSVQGIGRQGSWANKYLVVLAGELGWPGEQVNAC